MKKQLLLYFVVFCGLLGCENKDKKSAEELLRRIEYSFRQEKYNTAKLQIDSLNLLYRHHVKLRKTADGYLYQIEQIEVERNLAYFSTQIPKKRLELTDMTHAFTLEQNSVQELGMYIHNNIRGRASQTMLKAQVDESGRIFLTSIYYDRTNCSSQSVKLQSGDYFVLSAMIEPDDEVQGYSFTSGGGRWRILPLSEQESSTFARFVSLYYSDEILVSLVGNDCSSSYKLDEKQKEAIRETYRLSVLLKEINELKTGVENSKKQLAAIKQKIADRP